MELVKAALLLVVISLPFQFLGYAAHSALGADRPRAARLAGALLPAGSFLVVSLIVIALARRQAAPSAFPSIDAVVVLFALAAAAAGTIFNLICGAALCFLVYGRRG